MSRPLEFRTLRDYVSCYTLHVDCPGCHHHAPLNPMQPAQRIGWHATLAERRVALTCSKCGRRGAGISAVSDGRPALTGS